MNRLLWRGLENIVLDRASVPIDLALLRYTLQQEAILVAFADPDQ